RAPWLGRRTVRIILFVLITVLTAAGPVYYLTEGARARDERREHLRLTKRAADGVRALLLEHTPPPGRLLEIGEDRITRRRLALAQFARDVAAPLQAPAMDAAALRALARSAGVADVVLAPTLATLASDLLGAERQRALHAVLAAVSDSGDLVLQDLRIAREAQDSANRLPVQLLRVTMSLLGDATTLTGFSERLARGSDLNPPGDLVAAKLARPAEGVWNRLGWSKTSPPLSLKLTADLIVGRSSGP
ncbi:MAG: hypothetical protein V2A76_10565, partial [Planctomycetota bacterium]